MPKGTLKDIGRYSSVGMDLVASVLVGLLIGYFIDKKVPKVSPWGTVVFVFLGFFAGIKRLLALALRKNNKDGENGEK